MTKILTLVLVFLLPILVSAELKPVGTHSWQDSTNGKTVHAVGSSVPINYQNTDSSWERIDSHWEQINDTTWRVVKGKHKTYAFADGRAYYVLPRKGVRHAIGTDTRRLIKFNKLDSTWSTLFTASIDSVTISQGVDELDPSFLTFHDIFPGVDKMLVYDRGRYAERYIFHQEARDSLVSLGPWANHLIGTATKLDLDSLNLNFHDSLGQFSVGVKGRLIRGWLKCQKADTMVFTLSREYLWAEDTLIGVSDVIVWKRIVKLTGKAYLVEMFNPVPTASWADGDIWHNAGFGSEGDGVALLDFEDDIWAGIYSPASSGTADSMKIRLQISSSAKNVKGALYLWSDTSLVDSTEIRSISSGAEHWEYFDFILGGSITAFTQYALTAMCQAGGGTGKIDYISSGGTHSGQLSFGYGAWPDPWSTADLSGSFTISIYAYYTLEGEPAVGTIMRTVIR